MSWGGKRPGAGRKPKSDVVRAIDGTRDRRPGRILPHPSAPESGPVPIEEFDAPDDLTFDERKVWLELAPFAFANRTLTRATSFSFRLLCRNIVLEQALRAAAYRGGSDHRGLIQRVDAELLRFNLSPCGKALYDAAPAKIENPLDRFRNRKRG
jgi:hypothetical protein